MRKSKVMRKFSKGLLSVLLVMSIMLSLAVPFDITVSAVENEQLASVSEGEEPATGNDIYALVYDIRETANSGNGQGYELVFQKGNTPDTNVLTTDASTGQKRRVYKKSYTYDQFGASSLSLTDDQVKVRAPWYTDTPKATFDIGGGSSGSRLSQLFAKVTIKDKIKPESIAGWFFYFEYTPEFVGLENLDTSICTDMRYAFYNVNRVKKLDLHTFDTSKVQQISNFIYSYSDLEEVDVSGFDLSNVTKLSSFIKGGYDRNNQTEFVLSNLSKVNFSGMDISKIREISSFLTYTKDLEEITFDLNPRNVKDFMSAFYHNRGLKKFTFGSPGHLVQPGIDYYCTNNDTRLIRLNSMFTGCIALEEVDFQYLDLPDYLNTTTTEYDAANFLIQGRPAYDAIGYSRNYEYASMFKGCTSLTELKHIENLFIEAGNCSSWTHRYMFDGCESLETLDLSKIHAYFGGPHVFRNCKSLKTLNLINLGTAFYINSWSYSHNLKFQSYVNSGEPETNIFEGCTELSEVYLSPYYPPQANTVFHSDNTIIGCGNSCPPVDREWVKVELPDYYPDQYNTYKYAEYNGSSTNYKKLSEYAVPYPVGDPNSQKSTEDLFTTFIPQYAGRWVAVSKLNLKGNGGTPAIQQIKGAIGMVVDYEDEEVTEPIRNGYHFAGWYSEKKNGEGTELEKGQPAASWSYYAHWEDNHYSLMLNGNGGTTAAVAGTDENAGKYYTTDGKLVTETTGSGENIKALEYIADGNLAYSDFYELSSLLFSREGYILTGWNTRSNGEGDEYTANDSVNMLSSADGGEATLYAQWYKPDLIVSFDAQGGSEVSNRNYTLSNDPLNPTRYGDLPESTRNGYTFIGWYTAAEGGKKIVNKIGQLNTDEIRDVDGTYKTLYAHWEKDPTIIFDANGYDANNQPVAYFNGDTNAHTLPKVYKYGQYLGNIPTPEYGSAVLKGWYTDPVKEEDEETHESLEVTSSTVAGADGTTYYAHWGYRPKFESNGGTYEVFPTYAIQEGTSYTITTLPTIKKENSSFDGWYYNGTKLSNGDTIDLSSGYFIEARWNNKDKYTVTLLPNEGTLSESAKNPINVFAGNKVGELPTPTRAGYDFLGWYSGETKYTYETEINSDVTLTAQWAEQKWTVTFDAGEGTLFDSADATKKVRDNGYVTKLPGANRPDSTINYFLDGWYYMDGEVEKQLTATTAITKDIECYAKWKTADEKFLSAKDGLYTYTVRWNTPANEYVSVIGDDLIAAPDTGNNGISAMLYIQFNFNNTLDDTLDPYSVKILVPQYIFKDYTDKGIGSDNISTGLTKYVAGASDEENDTEGKDFIYKDNDPEYPGYYVITNNDPIDGTHQTQFFRISYELTAKELRSIKGGYTDENGYLSGVYYNTDLPVKILVDRNKDEDLTDVNDTDYTKTLHLEVHTDVKTTATKTQATASFDWDKEWGTKPDDADQYFYITWRLISIHDPSSGQLFKISWDETTVHDGSVVLMKYEKNSNTDWKEKGTFYTTVVTKHSRNPEDSGWKSIYNEAILSVEYLSGHVEQYRVSHTAGAYLLPAGDLQYEKYIKDYTRSGDRFKKGAQDKILARQSVTNLPFDIAFREYKNTDTATTWNDNTKKYTAPERYFVITDGAKNHGDVVLSTVKGVDRYNWDSSTNKVLSDSDYCFDTITVYMSEYDAVRVKTVVNNEDVWEWSQPYVHKSLDPDDPYVDYTDIEIWTRTEGESDFKLFKTIKNSELTATEDDESTEYDEREEYGVVNATVALPAKTVGYQIKHKSEFFTTKLYIRPNMCLYSSNKVLTYVRSDVSGGSNTLIKNNCTLDVSVWDAEREEYVAKPGEWNNDSKDVLTGGASICSYELGIGNSFICADKRIRGVQEGLNANDSAVTSTSNYQEFPAVISGWGYTDTEDTIKLIESGVFYDLLPYNFTVDKSSVYVKPIFGNIDGKANMELKNNSGNTTTSKATIGNYVAISQYSTKKTETQFYLNGVTYNSTAFDPAYYSVTFTENWEDSGRTMMTISINTPDGIDASGYYVFYKMKTNIANISANGTRQTNYVSFTDTTEDQSPPIAKDGNISVIDKKYAQYYTSIDDQYTAFASGSTSLIIPSAYATGVKSSVKSEGAFSSKDVTVGLDSDYTYNVTFTNSQPANNIVIYDILVNSLNGQTYDWNGELISVDTSALTSDELKSNSDPDAHMAPEVYYCIKNDDLVESDLDINKTDIWTKTAPSNMSIVKAIAVDCRKDENSNDYSLKANKSISFNISMHSPKDADNNVYTYNEAYAYGSILGDSFRNTTLTSILLHYADPELNKKSFPKTGDSDSERAGVVNKSVINYYLEISNPDDSISITDIVVEDLLDANLKLNNTPKVQIGEGEAVAINKAPIISSYEISEEGGQSKFTATISSLAPGATITIIVPATVNAALDAPIDNTAYITSANGRAVNDIISETTYHYVTVPQAKVKKVDSNGNGLAGALLEIYENTPENFDSTTGKIKTGADPISVTIGGNTVTRFQSTTDVITFNLDPGDYVLHEVDDDPNVTPHNIPRQNGYKLADDIPFTIDIEGITHVNGKSVEYVEMIDQPAFKIIFHENKPGGTLEEANKEFKVLEPKDLKNNKIEHFYDIPEWAGDEYVFAGWYHSSTYKSYTSTGNINQYATVAAIFDSETYSGANSKADDGNYHLYAKWIAVGTVARDTENDANLLEGEYRGFGIAGMQIRDPNMLDANYNKDEKPGGMRFVTSLSETLLNEIDKLSAIDVDDRLPVEYGYVVGTEANIKTFTAPEHYNIKEPTKYQIQYLGENVNGVNTTGEEKTAATDYRYVTNVDCTSKIGTATTSTFSGSEIAKDHRNFGAYRLYTLVVTYDGDSASKKDENLVARAYIRYYDANGKLRVFYNTYRKSMYSGCMCSYNQISAMLLEYNKQMLEQQQKTEPES